MYIYIYTYKYVLVYVHTCMVMSLHTSTSTFSMWRATWLFIVYVYIYIHINMYFYWFIMNEWSCHFISLFSLGDARHVYSLYNYIYKYIYTYIHFYTFIQSCPRPHTRVWSIDKHAHFSMNGHVASYFYFFPVFLSHFHYVVCDIWLFIWRVFS